MNMAGRSLPFLDEVRAILAVGHAWHARRGGGREWARLISGHLVGAHEEEPAVFSSSNDKLVEKNRTGRPLVEITLFEQHLIARGKEAGDRERPTLELELENAVAKALIGRGEVTVTGLQVDVACCIGRWGVAGHPYAAIAPVGGRTPKCLEGECCSVVDKEPSRQSVLVVATESHIEQSVGEEQSSPLLPPLNKAVGVGCERLAADVSLYDHRALLDLSGALVEVVDAILLVVGPIHDIKRVGGTIDDRSAEDAPPGIVHAPHVEISAPVLWSGSTAVAMLAIAQVSGPKKGVIIRSGLLVGHVGVDRAFHGGENDGIAATGTFRFGRSAHYVCRRNHEVRDVERLGHDLGISVEGP